MNLALMTTVLTRRSELRRHERWSRVRLESYQAAALREMRDFAYARSPFYQQFHRGLTSRPLHELPVLTKTELMERFYDIVTDRKVRRADAEAYLQGLEHGERFLDRYWVASTSGSTGRRGLFLWDSDEWATVLASYSRANEWAGVAPGLGRRMRLAVVSSTAPWHQSALVGATVRGALVPTIRIDSGEPISTIVERLNAFRPACLVAYASMARLLAEEQLAGRLRISPGAVMSASEVLTAVSRRRIEEAWGVVPFDTYVATETAGIASECSQHAGLHLHEDLVIAEPVDEAYLPVPPGVPAAKLLVTVLFSRTQPLIRYEMSDRVWLATRPCACGRVFALLGGIEGRDEEMIQLAGMDGRTVLIHPVVFHRALATVPAREWQVVQEGPALRVLVAEPKPGFDEHVLEDALGRALAAAGALVPSVHVQRVEHIPRTAAGKAQLVRAEARRDDPRRAGL